jgi:hypothetical protein
MLLTSPSLENPLRTARFFATPCHLQLSLSHPAATSTEWHGTVALGIGDYVFPM